MITVNSLRPINFKLISCTVQGSTTVSIFEAPTAMKNRTYHLETIKSPKGSFSHYSVI